MSLVLDTTPWAQTLWRSHLRYDRSAQQSIAAGAKKQPDFAGLADDIHGVLYSRQAPPARPNAPAWATALLRQTQELAEWKPLKSRCMTSGFQAGIATASLLRALVQLTPDPMAPPTPRRPRSMPGIPSQADPDQAGDTRRALRHALRAAGEEVDTAEALLEGLEGGAGGPLDRSQQGSLVALEQVRELYHLLSRNRVMQQMAEMAGRLQRLVASQKKSQAQSQVGAITGLTLGGDLARILPSELAGLRGGRLARLQVLATIQGRKALQYDVKGDTPETRGPVIVLLDKSGSMGSEQIAWEAAFALTLLTICQQQGRVFALINFDDKLHDELVLEPSSGVTPEVCHALCHDTGGDTDFEKPLARALALLQEEGRLKHADIFFLTDGMPSRGCAPSPATLAGLQHLRDTEGLSVFGLGIGAGARLSTIQAIASQTFQLSSRPQDEQGDLVPLLGSIASPQRG